MAVYRYKAATGSGEITTGVLDAADAPDARLRLRSSDLRVLDLRPAKRQTKPPGEGSASAALALDRWLRSRRAEPRAAFFDGLGTLLRSGLSLRRSLAVLGEGRRQPASVKRLVASLEREIAGGRSFDHATAARPNWFDGLDAAVIAAGVRHGELAPALFRLAARNRQTSELRAKLIAALSYPVLVLAVAAIVVAVLSTRTLPPIVGMLTDAEIPVPGLTAAVMRIGAALTNPASLAVAVAFMLGGVVLAPLARGVLGRRMPPVWVVRRLPGFLMLPMLASLARSIADLTATGVPIAESLRIAEPTLRGPCANHLRETVAQIRRRLEQGDDLSDAFDDKVWFDPSFHRLLAVGQDAGELPAMLRRLADRNDAQARRAVDRLAAMLEPAAILAMSAVVGAVVLAAVLPLIRMQELL